MKYLALPVEVFGNMAPFFSRISSKGSSISGFGKAKYISPTYSITASTTSVNEGSSVTFDITIPNITNAIVNGNVFYWTTTGSVNSSDFSDGVTSGSVTITNRTASITRTLTSDSTTEGSESFQLELRSGSTSGLILATSATVTVNDTSTTPSGGGGGGYEPPPPPTVNGYFYENGIDSEGKEGFTLGVNPTYEEVMAGKSWSYFVSFPGGSFDTYSGSPTSGTFYGGAYWGFVKLLSPHGGGFISLQISSAGNSTYYAYIYVNAR